MNAWLASRPVQYVRAMVRNRLGASDAIRLNDEHDAIRTIDTRRKNTAVYLLTKYAGGWKMQATGTLKPWAQTPFELLRHAEGHLRSGTDFDRRIAMVGFDNSIEVSVITYLSLNPIQRGNRQFAREAVVNWNRNFHTKLEFLEAHAKSLDVPMEIERAWLVFYHELRNDLYHAGNGLVPAEEHLLGIRRGAIWAFSLLFECDGEALLDACLSDAKAPANPPESTERIAVAMSDATTFLQAFLSAKQAADELLELRGKTADFTSLLAEARATSEVIGTQTDPVPAELVESLARAEQAKDLVLRGDTPAGDTPPLDSLVQALDKFALRLRSTLRSHQQEIALGALKATLSAQAGNRRAGVVTQPTGSGISGSLLAYLALCSQHHQLNTLRYVVLTDMRVFVDQFAKLYEDMLESGTQRKLIVPDSRAMLERVLRTASSDVVVTTVQQLGALPDSFAGNCVVIGYNLSSTAVSAVSRFPRGIYILFSSGPLGSIKFRDEVREVFGESIRDLAFQDAVRLQLVPVQVKQYAGSGTRSVSQEKSRGRGQLTEPMLEWVARTVLGDANDRVEPCAGKAVILVPGIASGTRLVHVIERLRGEHSASTVNLAAPYGAILASTSTPKAGDLIDRFLHSGLPAILVTTPARLAGLDLPIVDRCYVTFALSVAARGAVFSLVSRRQLGKIEGYVHDFGGNEWRNPFDDDAATLALV
ncbi:hypothetical protein [Burkholderia ambifaria]|uniref:hypothetical protein n=1 Tax=Burkholderia ambifaria TaxID=152480 RepID=UPI0015896C24|nr:hypothetical protein [Burkholderia ambifaria]MBR8344756.1 hypothetical protein [Burkholderia ambifaria]